MARVCMDVQPPPWLCMKEKYIHMAMLIQGPRQPGNDINLYLGLLKEELQTLWTTRSKTWDASKGEYFYIAKKYRDRGVHRTDAEVIRDHNSTFVRWFKERVLANPPEEGCPNGTLIYALANGPSTKDRKSTRLNSSHTLASRMPSSA